MCGSTKAPPVVQDNPIKDAAIATAKAQWETNAEIAMRRRQRLQNSLLTIGPAGTQARVDTPQTLLATVAGSGGRPGQGAAGLLGGAAGGGVGGVLGGGGLPPLSDPSRLGVWGGIAQGITGAGG